MEKEMTEVTFGSQQVSVIAGGFYDRYRMNPDLDQVAKDPLAGDISWFRTLPKRQLDSRVGLTWAPNFYYRSQNLQLLMLAPLAKLKAALPVPLEPLRALPGYGLVALTFFSYDLCDNDPYQEASVAVVIRAPGAKGSQLGELISAMGQRHFHAHVLALPVTTEIARVRGVEAYQLPKWRADIDLEISDKASARILGPDGKVDLAVSAPLPRLSRVPSQSHMSQATMVHQVDGCWQQTRVQTNTLAFAQQLLPRKLTLTRGQGPLSTLLQQLGAGRVLRFDVMQDAQSALHLPTPLGARL